MARHEVVLIKCDRCKREELQPSSKEAKTVADFECKFKDIKVTYFDLCTACQETMTNYMESIQQWTRDIKSLLGPKLDANTAPPVTVAPDYSPPKPHSLAAVKR